MKIKVEGMKIQLTTPKLSRQYGLNLKTKLNNQTKNATSAAAASVTQHIPETSRKQE